MEKEDELKAWKRWGYISLVLICTMMLYMVYLDVTC